MLVDGGLPRSHQQTGKNAADFVDWKFAVEYGDLDIHLDAMVASHCDKDHYGGLEDLVSPSKFARSERDTRNVRVDALFHAGLSYWEFDEQEADAFPDESPGRMWLGLATAWNGPGRDGAGSFVDNAAKPARVLTRLLGDEGDVAGSLQQENFPNLHGAWRTFFRRCVKAGAGVIRPLAAPFDALDAAVHVPGWDRTTSRPCAS